LRLQPRIPAGPTCVGIGDMLPGSLRLVFLGVFITCSVQAAEVSVVASKRGDTFYVEASAEFEADERQTWKTLTDYAHLSDFVPGIRTSRIILREGHDVVVEQKGEAALLFFSYPLEVTLAVEEFPYEKIVSHAIAGDFRVMRNAYRVEKRGRHIRLHYAGTLVPGFLVPPIIGTLVLRANIAKQFRALVDEIVRRQRNAVSGEPTLHRVGG